jgi:hypothetical protein
MYYQPSTNQVFTLHGEIRSALWASASVIFESVITDAALAEAGVFPLRSERPDAQHGEIVEPRAIEQIDDAWVQQWTVRAATPDEQTAIDEGSKVPVPQEVSMRQARLALLARGVLGHVDAAIESLPSPDREAARIEWDYSSVVARNSPLVEMMGAALGLDDDALDELFITAARL